MTIRTLMVLIALWFWSWSVEGGVSDTIPPRALPYLPVVKEQADKYLPELPYPAYFGALIEHESCISLTHSRCWSPTSELRTKREQGVGLGQITRTYQPNGQIRFDVLSEMRRQHSALSELSWSNVKQRPDLQIRAIVLMTRTNYMSLSVVTDSWERLAMTDAAYNAGLGGLQKDRRACGLAAKCDPQKWFGHIANTCMKSRKALYSGRSACDINRHHVTDVLNTRYPKYKPYF